MNLQTLKIKKRAGDTMPFHHDHYIEASHVDYKERLEEKKPRSWLKSVSAFANTEGGHLIFGVKNEPREVVGLENPQAVVSRLTKLIKVRIDPSDSGTGQYGKCGNFYSAPRNEYGCRSE